MKMDLNTKNLLRLTGSLSVACMMTMLAACSSAPKQHSDAPSSSYVASNPDYSADEELLIDRSIAQFQRLLGGNALERLSGADRTAAQELLESKNIRVNGRAVDVNNVDELSGKARAQAFKALASKFPAVYTQDVMKDLFARGKEIDQARARTKMIPVKGEATKTYASSSIGRANDAIRNKTLRLSPGSAPVTKRLLLANLHVNRMYPDMVLLPEDVCTDLSVKAGENLSHIQDDVATMANLSAGNESCFVDLAARKTANDLVEVLHVAPSQVLEVEAQLEGTCKVIHPKIGNRMRELFKQEKGLPKLKQAC